MKEYKNLLVAVFLNLIGLMMFGCSEDETHLSDTSVDSLKIFAGTICGWTVENDSLYITATRTTYNYENPTADISFKKDTVTDPAVWSGLVKLLDLDTFNKINIDDCAFCVDGCDLWIRVNKGETLHRITLDYSFITDNRYTDSASLQSLRPFILRLDSVRLRMKNRFD